jgi:hypothetical protein
MHGTGTSRGSAYWKVRKANEVARECEQLKIANALLKSEMAQQRDFVGGLQLVLRQRNRTIDNLNDKLAQSREQCRKLDAEADRLAALFQTWRDWWTPPKD